MWHNSIGSLFQREIWRFEPTLRTAAKEARWPVTLTAFQVFLKASESGELTFCQTPPIPIVKNVLEHVTSDDAKGANYYLCEHPTKHIRIPIFIPHVRYDCQLVVRTSKQTKATYNTFFDLYRSFALTSQFFPQFIVMYKNSKNLKYRYKYTN